MTSSLVPWNTCGATMTGFLGVSPAQYAPYAFLNLLSPIVSIVFAFTGITMHKMTDEEYDAVLKARAEEKEKALKEAI